MNTVLIVDDNADERLIFAAVLQHHGYCVVTAGDGPGAIDAAEQYVPAVILMDVNLPGINGLAATQVIRATPKTAQIPVICVTSFDVTAAEARGAGCQSILRKPVSPSQLINAVSATITNPAQA
jgi:two-component system, cell cycle response regulator DivK